MRLERDDDSTSYASSSSNESSLDSAVKNLTSRTISIHSGKTGDVSDGSSSVYSSSSSEVSGFDSSEDDTESSGSESSTDVNLEVSSISEEDLMNDSDNSLELLTPSTKVEILPNDTPQMNDSLSHIPSLLDEEGADSDDEEDLLNSIPEHTMPSLTSDEEDGFDTESSNASMDEITSSLQSDKRQEPQSGPTKRIITKEAPPKLLDDSSSGNSSDSSISFTDTAPQRVAPKKSSAKSPPKKAEPAKEPSVKEEKQKQTKKAKAERKPPVENLVIDEKLAAKQAARAARMEKVKARIAREKKEKEEEEANEKKKKKEAKAELDCSESARRERAYSWYTRSAMPNRKNFKARVRGMPLSSGITEDDVDLLPWNSSCTMVNISEMNSILFKR